MVADSGMQLLQIVSGGAQQPEFLSTHPSGTRRIQDLQGRMPLALGVAQTAKTQGRRPQCQR